MRHRAGAELPSDAAIVDLRPVRQHGSSFPSLVVESTRFTVDIPPGHTALATAGKTEIGRRYDGWPVYLLFFRMCDMLVGRPRGIYSSHVLPYARVERSLEVAIRDATG